MADDIGRSRRTISNYESDSTEVPLLVLKEYALRTAVPLDWIRYGIAPANGDDGGPNLGGTPTACNADIIAFPVKTPLARTA